MASLKSLRFKLQETVNPKDSEWSYHVAGLPGANLLNNARLVKLVSFSTKRDSLPKVELSFVIAPSNRMTWNEPLDKFILLAISDFRLCYPPIPPEEGYHQAPMRETGDYLTRLVQHGISINGQSYHFFGNSNSQTKSRSCFLYAASKSEISAKIEAAGDFSKMKTVAKKVKRIGLLFSAADMGVTLPEARCQDIDDIERDEYCFTDGCGLISEKLARFLVQRRNITYRNKRYVPSVFQIRYRGYKGVLTVDPNLTGQTAVQFRKSMKKFNDAKDLTLSVVDYSRPYAFGFLNDEIVLLMSALGISTNVLLQKQSEYIDFLRDAARGVPDIAFRFLASRDRLDLAEKLLIEGVEAARPELRKMVKDEYAKMVNKRDEQRCRILIPRSRLLFGICDPCSQPGRTPHIPEGCCFVRITNDGDGDARTVVNTEVLVTRNPCSHPGDLQKLRVVDIPEYAHLTDCVVFSVKGPRPSADLMSGGDLDGDKFFVTWDPDLVPSIVSQAAQYPGVKEPISFGPITDDDRAEYFARYTSASLGRVKNLYMKWARIKGPMSQESQELNRLFSQCVDGNRIKIPQRLEDAPTPGGEFDSTFVLDVLHKAAKERIEASAEFELESISFDAVDMLLSRDQIPISEHELVQMTLKWCERRGTAMEDYLPFFNSSALTDEQQAWLIGRLPASRDTPSFVRNGLLQSDLLNASELRRFRLDHSRLSWRPVFKSTEDRLGRFLPTVCRSLELFHKKLILLKVDERLTIGIYVPKKISKSSEAQVDASVRVFAFPRSSGPESANYCAVPTKINYRLYYDEHVFQLYNLKRGDTWIFLQKGPKNDASYRNTTNAGDKRRQMQATLDNGANFDCRASIALQKINSRIQKHVGRLNRAGILGAEIYTISNRDVRSMKLLDEWLHFVDTEEVLPLFEEEEREYSLPTFESLDLNDVPSAVQRVVQRRDLSCLKLISLVDIQQILSIVKKLDDKSFILKIYTQLLNAASSGDCLADTKALTLELLEAIPRSAYLVKTFLQSEAWCVYRDVLEERFKVIGPKLLHELVLLADSMLSMVCQPFHLVLQHLTFLSFDNLASVVELIAGAVRRPEVAMDLVLECLEPETSRLLVGRPKVIAQFAKNLTGIALNRIDEIQDHKAAEGTLQLELDGWDDGFTVTKAIIRLDSPLNGLLRSGDHVRFTTMQPPQNAPLSPPYTMAAMVIKAEQGTAHFRCLHQPPSFVAETAWKITHYGSFVTAKTMFDAVTKFYTEQAGCCRIFNQLTAASEIGDVVFEHDELEYVRQPKLNDSQNLALELALKRPLALLWGPPGTGKTFTVVAILIQFLIQLPSKRVLLTAPTHNAVDNILQKFISEDGIAKTGIQPLRVSTDVRKVSGSLRQYTCDAMVGKDLNSSFGALKKAKKRVKESGLIFTTCTGAGLGLLREESFEIVLVDEASQQTEPETLIPLVKGCERAVLVGDHVQLRATVQRSAVAIGFDVSLFERHYNLTDTPTKGKVMLDTQYRMHADICDFSSKEFYEAKLKTAVQDSARPLKPSQFPWPEQGRKIFIQCSASEDIGRQSKSNSGQAMLCKRVCGLLCSLPADPATVNTDQSAFQTSEVGILTPYTRQKELLKTVLPGHEISSIDGFQGREAEIIVFVTTRCNLSHEMGFLSDLRRLNVAATRAKTGLIIIGDRATLTTTAPGVEMEESRRCWARLLSQCQEVVLPEV